MANRLAALSGLVLLFCWTALDQTHGTDAFQLPARVGLLRPSPSLWWPGGNQQHRLTYAERSMRLLAINQSDLLSGDGMDDVGLYNREQLIQQKRRKEKEQQRLQEELERQEEEDRVARILQDEDFSIQDDGRVEPTPLRARDRMVANTNDRSRGTKTGPRLKQRNDVVKGKTTQKKQSKPTKKKLTKKKKKKATKKVINRRTDPRQWAYAWLEGERRQTVMDLTVDMQCDHISELEVSGTTDLDVDEWCRHGKDEILCQWAKLAEAARCQDFAYRLLDIYPNGQVTQKQLALDVEVHRPVLYAHCNTVFRTLYDGQSRKTKTDPSNDEKKRARLAAQNADRCLRHMEAVTKEYAGVVKRAEVTKLATSKQSTPSTILVDGSDYINVVLSYCRTSQPIGALKALRRMEVIAEENPKLTRLLPTVALYVTVMKLALRRSRPYDLDNRSSTNSTPTMLEIQQETSQDHPSHCCPIQRCTGCLGSCHPYLFRAHIFHRGCRRQRRRPAPQRPKGDGCRAGQ